ncbi:MAG TPA: hypothetical protein VGF73_05040 [Chthoniobacterales bacterium]
MTSQITDQTTRDEAGKGADCRPPENGSSDYCRRLKSGLGRLENSIRSHYEAIHPSATELISRAIREAREACWTTPFPSLFFPVLAQLRMSELFPTRLTIDLTNS